MYYTIYDTMYYTIYDTMYYTIYDTMYYTIYDTMHFITHFPNSSLIYLFLVDHYTLYSANMGI